MSKKNLANVLFCLIIFTGLFSLQPDPILGMHKEYHEGPSCGDCHCEVDQECTSSGSGSCGCHNEKEFQLN